MNPNFYQVLQDALRLPADEQVQLREALEDASSYDPVTKPGSRVAGLNQNDPRVLLDFETPLAPDYLGELP